MGTIQNNHQGKNKPSPLAGINETESQAIPSACGKYNVSFRLERPILLICFSNQPSSWSFVISLGVFQ